MRTCWILLTALLSLTLGSCGPSQTVVKDFPTPVPAETNIISTIPPDETSMTASGVTTPIATPTVIETDAWKTYHNTEAGYSAEYPADWMVNESAGINSAVITSFMSPNNGQGIVVNISNSEAALDEIPDMPNTRCQRVTISGLTAWSCLDTLALNFSTTFMDQGRQYIIASSGKHPDQNIYQHFLDSFTVIP